MIRQQTVESLFLVTSNNGATMERLDLMNCYYRGTLKPNIPYEVWGLTEHTVSVVIPKDVEVSEISIHFAYMPYTLSEAAGSDKSLVGVTKTVKKSGVILVTGRFASVSWSGLDADGIVVHYAGYPR